MRRPSSPLALALALLPACSFEFGPEGADEFSETGNDSPTTGGPTGADEGECEFDDCGPMNACETHDCGPGQCVEIDDQAYCECPEGTSWSLHSCQPCPLVTSDFDLEIPVVTLTGKFLLDGKPTPADEFDDANLWLENFQTGDRVLLGNTHDQEYTARVVPGVYDLVYESETPGDALPHNPRISLRKVAVSESGVLDVAISPVARIRGSLTINGQAPPSSEFDDAQILVRQPGSEIELPVASTRDGEYSVVLVLGAYEVVYRSETPGPIMPHNDGAVIELLSGLYLEQDIDIDVDSTTLSGEFLLDGAPPPASEFDDANITLESDEHGRVALGNTHDQEFSVPVIAGDYTVAYAHESGANVPQNRHARLPITIDTLAADEPVAIDIPMVSLAGAMTINGAPPPASEFDDGTLTLRGVDSDDEVPLANTREQSYAVNLIPGTYELHYAVETAGATVPANKHARLGEALVVDQDASFDVDVPAVTVSGSFSFAGEPPPSSTYEDARVYLRDAETGDSVLLGNTYEGGYAALVVPGDYALHYAHESGDEVPGNQDALLFDVSIDGDTQLDVDVPVVELGGKFLFDGDLAPQDSNDGGQLYLRSAAGDSVLLGDSFAPQFSAKLVAGTTYGVYYRAQASKLMPLNDNGRFACFSVE